MSDYVVMPKEDYVSTCDVLREKTGSTELIKSGELASKVAEIESGSDNSTLNSLLDGSFEGEITSDVENVRAYALYNCTKITSLNLSKALSIGAYACAFASNALLMSLTNVDARKAIEIGDNAFRSCVSLTSINIPLVETIGTGAFYFCGLTFVNLPNVTAINTNAFYQCKALTTIILEKQATLASTFSVQAATIYVKQTDLEWYSTATNWSSLYEEGRIKTIEDNLEYLESLGYVSEVSE